MWKNTRIILLGLVFGGALSLFAYNNDYYFYILFFLFFVSFIVLWPLIGRLRFVTVPFFLSVGSLNLLYLIDGFYERVIFITLTVLAYIISLWGAYRLKLYDCDQTAQSLINIATIIAMFFWMVSNYGWYLNFEIESWVLVIAMMSSLLLVVYPSLTIVFVSCYKLHHRQKMKNKKLSNQELLVAFWRQMYVQKIALFFSFVIAFIMGGIIWGLSLWPFGYLSTGMTGVLVFFLFWVITKRFIQKKLTKRFVVVNIAITLVLILIIVLTSPWDIVQ